MTWDEWIARNEHQFDSRFEREFALEILSQIPNLPPEKVAAQTKSKDLDGELIKIDFTISEGKYVRIAIEVDGWDKTGNGLGQSKEEHRRQSFRDLSLAASPWGMPLHCANGLIERRPEELRKSIEVRLLTQRGVERAIRGDAAEEDRVRNEQRDVQEAAQRVARGGGKSAEDELNEAESKRRRNERERLSPEEREAIEGLERELEDLRGENEVLKRENKGTKGLAALFALVVLAIVAMFLVCGDEPDVPPSACDDATPANELSPADEGERVKAKGEVVEATRIDEGVFLNLGGANKSQDLTVVIWEENLDNWPTPPEAQYDGREVAVIGELGTYKGILQVEANSPNDVVLCP